jgi:cobalt-zinc-cadmium efflux system outer membrane protein
VACTAALQAQVTTDRDGAAQYLDQRDGMGLDDAIARAVAKEPTLRAARADVDSARAERDQAGLRPNPMLSIEHRDEPGGTDALTTVGVEWPLELFRRSGRVHTADQSVAVSEFSAQDRERVLIADVRLLYGAVVASVRDVEVADELVAAAREQLRLVRARVDAGSTPPLDADLLDVEVRRLAVARLLAIGRAEAALAQLKPLLALAPSDALRLREPLDGLVASTAGPQPEEATVVDTRPDVREATARVALADARIEQAQREGRADLSVFGSYMRMDNGFPQQGIGPAGGLERVRGRFNYVAIGATVSLPLLNRNQGQVAAAQAGRQGAEARREASELAARAELAAAQARDARAQEAVRVYRGGLREVARRNLDVVRQTFELGRATVFDVLAEQKRWLDVEQGYTSALRDAWEARVALMRAVGETR